MIRWIFRSIRLGLGLVILTALLFASNMPPGDKTEQARFFTRQIEFDYIDWTLDAVLLKLGQSALGLERYLPEQARSQLVLDYIDLLRQIGRVEAEIRQIYSDPAVPDPQSASASQRQQLDEMTRRRQPLQLAAEGVLQAQISQVAASFGLTFLGQAVPPVLFHITAPPYALIISPRNAIRQDQDISISPDLTIPEQVDLENKIDKTLNVSSLVVGIGGVGLYPTMVMQTTSINWLAEVVAHEWIHNTLTLHPLGASYMSTPELRIMNETAASIAGKELGAAVIERFYPEYAPPPPAPVSPQNTPQPEPAEPPAFNYNREMHTTRIEVDRLLALGDISGAETYMESRRRFMWENGYQIRKINQAFFAFYGAYADQEAGAAGQDPVGAAVRQLRAQSANLAAFIDHIQWMWSFEQLQAAVKKN